MKSLLLITTLLFITSRSFSQEEHYAFDWVGAYESIGGVTVANMTTDSLGNVYVTGGFNSTVDFDQSSGTYFLSSLGSGTTDIYVQKFDKDGLFLWVKQIGNTSSDKSISHVMDESGNIYITGIFGGTVDFDPSASIHNVTSNGSYDVFILKLNTEGDFQWVNTIGSTSADHGNDIFMDESGNLYITGEFTNTVDFDPGVGVYELTADSRDIFVLKLDDLGDFQWAVSAGGTSIDRGSYIHLDSEDNIIIAGSFANTVDFDPGAGIDNRTSNGLVDIFILKLDNDGEYLWAKTIGNSDFDDLRGLTIDTDDNIYYIGDFKETVDFDPGLSEYDIVSNGNTDFFIEKLNSDGDFIWAQGRGSLYTEVVRDIIIDDNDKLILTGYFNGEVDFDVGPDAQYMIPNDYSRDIFILKLTLDGNFEWMEKIGDYGPEDGGRLTSTSSGLLVSGSFYHTTDFDFSDAEELLTADFASDPFILYLRGDTIHSYDTLIVCTDYTWIDDITYTTNNPSLVFIEDLAIVHVHHLHLTVDPFYFEIHTNTIVSCDSYTWIDDIEYTSSTEVPTVTYTNIYGCDSIINLNLTINNSNAIVVEDTTTCNMYTWSANGITYTESTIDTVVLSNILGCDSLLGLNLTINYSDTILDIVSACNSYYWSANGNTYTTSGSRIAVLTNIHSCDSIIRLDLTIHHSDTTTAIIAACAEYYWATTDINYTESGYYSTTLTNIHDCDSVVNLDLSIGYNDTTDQVITACSSYYWSATGITYTESTIQTATLANVYSCDSIVNLDLTIVFEDVTIARDEMTLTVSISDAIYQWVNCDTDYSPIADATEQSFTAIENGNYAVIYTRDDCTDTSACFTIDDLGLLNTFWKEQILLYPNPTAESCTIDFGQKMNKVSIKIINPLGQVIAQKMVDNKQIVTIDLEGEKGIYILEIIINDKTTTFLQIVKQ